MANTNFLESILNTPCIIEGRAARRAVSYSVDSQGRAAAASPPPDPPPGGRGSGRTPPNHPPGGGMFLLGLGLGGLGGYSLHDKIKRAVDDPDEALRSLRDKLASLDTDHHEA